MKELTLAVVGIDYPNADRAKTNRRSELLLLAPGTAIDLRPEPKNPHDEHAVAVFSPSGIQVGYLTSERAVFISARIRAGDEVAAIYQGLAGAAGYIRVRIGGGQPTLPPDRGDVDQVSSPARSADGDNGFFPDPDGPEWGA